MGGEGKASVDKRRKIMRTLEESAVVSRARRSLRFVQAEKGWGASSGGEESLITARRHSSGRMDFKKAGAVRSVAAGS